MSKLNKKIEKLRAVLTTKEQADTLIKNLKDIGDFSEDDKVLMEEFKKIFHLGTKSYAEHKALQGYYEGIDALVDGIIESYQGKYGILKYKNVSKIEQYESKEQVIEYFNKILKIIEKTRPIKDAFIDNTVQEVESLIYSTLYKLKYLN